ncbi:hypothetical protein BH10PSE13_BH10PSE13_02810 [soil metagenome]
MPYMPPPGPDPGYAPSQARGPGYAPAAGAGQSGQKGPAPKIEQVCGTPGEMAIYIPPPYNQIEYASVLGTFAERRIQVDYCEQHACQEYLRPGSLQYDYFDNSRDPKVLISYYKNFNPHVTDKIAAEMLSYSRRRKMFKFADIVRHLEDVQQHFEIKPASRSGIADGLRKLSLLDAFVDYFKLPYRRGTFYTPSPEMPLATIKIDTIPIELFLSVEQRVAGLILYRFCVRGELTEAMKRMRQMLGDLMLIVFLIGIILPIDDPIEEPVRDPVKDPQPVPWPIPAGASFILPVPYRGNIDGERNFPFKYVRGLSRTHKKGKSYPVTISFESQGKEYMAVVDFTLRRVKDNASYLESANKGTVNIAPAGHTPLILSPKTAMVVQWHE